MKKQVKWGLAALVIALLAGGGLFAAKGMSKSKADNKPDAPKLLEFTPNEIATVKQVSLPLEVQSTGVLSAERSAIVRAKASAIVTRVLVEEGQTVKAGQVIAQLDSAELQQRLAAQEGALAASQARLVAAKKARDQQQTLFNQQYISQTALDAAQSGFDAAQGDTRAAQAQVALAKQALGDAVVHAPLAGVVSKRYVQTGEKVSFDAPLAQIVDLSRLELQSWVPPDALSQLKVGSNVKVQVTGITAPILAKVKTVLPVADASTRQLGVVISIPNSNQQMKAGLQATAFIMLESRSGLAVPSSAVADNAGVQSVWVTKPKPAGSAPASDDERIVNRVNVNTALRDDAQGISQIIGKDINQGDVVLAGRYDGLRDGQTVKFVSAPSAKAYSPASPAPAASAANK